MVKHDKDVHITIRRFLTSGKAAEQPCFQDWLCLEILSYKMCHYLLIHPVFYFVMVQR